MAYRERTIAQAVASAEVDVLTGTRLEDVVEALEDGPVHVVIMGAGLPLTDRLAIIEHVFTVSSATSVHMKDRDSGRDGMLPFVNAVLRGLIGSGPSAADQDPDEP